MSVAVENLITNLRKKNAEDEAKRISMEEKNAIDRKRKSDKLQAAEKKTLDALDKFKESLSRGKKTKAGEVIASRLSEAEKEQVSVLNESVKAAQEDLKFNRESEAQRQAEEQQRLKAIQFQNDVAMQTRGISLQSLEEEKSLRKDIALQRQALEQMLQNDAMSAEDVKKSFDYKVKQDQLERQEKRLQQRVDRQVRLQNLKQFLSIQNLTRTMKNFGEGIRNLGRSAIDKVTGAVEPALKGVLGAAGLAAAYFGLQAFLKSELFQDLKDFMVGLADQFRLIGSGFKKLFQGDILGGLKDILLGLGGIIGKVLDSLVTGLYNIIARVFGLSETDSVFGSIKGFIMGIYNGIKNAFTGAMNAIKEYFSFSAEELGVFCKFIDIVYFPLNLAINFLKDIFKFGDPDEPFRLSQFLVDVVNKVKSFFKDLFSFDMSGLKERISGVGQMFKALALAGAAAIKAALPGGESPAEAFRRVYDEAMSGGTPTTGTTQNLLDMADERAGVITGDAGEALRINEENVGGKFVRTPPEQVTPSYGFGYGMGGNMVNVINNSTNSDNRMVTSVANPNIQSSDSFVNQLVKAYA